MRAVLLLGPPGSGKTYLTRQMAGALPAMEGQVLLEASWIWWGSRIIDSVVGFGKAPFRAPHHTCSEAALVGGGWKRPSPGEVSLAHGGCLMLDELPEFRKSCIESVGRALKAGEARLVGSHETVLPARPALLVAAANVCPCGWTGTGRECVCKPEQLARWNARIVEYCDLLGIEEIVPMSYQTNGRLVGGLGDRSGSMSPEEVLRGMKEMLEATQRA